MKHERIQFTTELRSIEAEDGNLRKIVGRPAVFNSLSEDLGGFREIIKPGAFKKTLSERNVKSLWNHDTNYVLGSVKAGTLSVREDETGLYFEAIPPDAQWARDMMASIDRGDVDQMSFGFRAINDEWVIQTIDGDDVLVRMLTECALFEVSPVTFPAYPDTTVGLRDRFDKVTLHDRFGTERPEEVMASIRTLAGNPATHPGNRETTEPPAPASGSEERNHSAEQSAPDLSWMDRRLEDIEATL